MTDTSCNMYYDYGFDTRLVVTNSKRTFARLLGFRTTEFEEDRGRYFWMNFEFLDDEDLIFLLRHVDGRA